jgi:hypothetical protein
MAQSNRMDPSVYEHLLAINVGFEQVRRALTALGRRRGFDDRVLARYGELSEEARAATTSYLLEIIESAETKEAGRLSGRRLRRERKEERA